MNQRFLFLCISLQLIFFVRSENKLIAMLIENVMECMTQAPESFTMETCQEMLQDNNDNSLPKYNDCKCLSTCTAKRMGVIDDKGNGNMDKLKGYIAMIEAKSWANEAQAIVDKCQGTKGDGCELAYNWMNCALTNSKMTLDLVKTFMGDVTKPDEKE